MIEDFKALKDEAIEKMDKSIQFLKDEYKKLRTGRANAAMVEDIKFIYYGNPTPIKQAASVQTPDPHSILIDPWDKSALHAIEKGISDSGMGFTASNDGRVIRVSVPPLTEERKREMVKFGKEMAEDSRVVVRNWRRDINAKIKQLLKDGHIGEDEEHKELDEIQKVTDNHIKNIDDLVANKEKEIMEV
jgi:ribosome recycling factor